MQIGQIIRSYTVEPLVEPVAAQPAPAREVPAEVDAPRPDVAETLPALVSRDAR